MATHGPCTVVAPAKLNLNLFVTGRRSDGYHTLDSVMQTIALEDRVTLSATPISEDGTWVSGIGRIPDLYLTVDGIKEAQTGPAARNLAVRAYHGYLERFGTAVLASFHERGALPDRMYLHIEKHIPSGAGMGGGSADAAAVLWLLAARSGWLHDPDQMAPVYTLAATLGADVPFALHGGTARAEGIGEVLTRVDLMPTWHLCLVKPDLSISTAEAFHALDQVDRPLRTYAIDQAAFIVACRTQDVAQMVAYGGNDFLEATAAYAPLRKLVHLLESTEPLYAGLTGSGSTVFAVYRDRRDAEHGWAQVQASSDVMNCWHALTVNRPADYNRCIM